MENFTVYMHIFPNGKKYIGITCKSVKRRWRSGSGYKYQSLMNKAIQKYGWENIQHEILFENLTKEKACEIEEKLIKKYKTNSLDYGYNLSVGGELSGLGVPCSEEKKKKLHEIHKGKRYTYNYHHSMEVREKLSKALKGNKNNFGKKLSEETKKKIGKANAISLKGNIPWNRGKKCPNLSGVNAYQSKKINQYKLDGTFVKQWNYIKQAEIEEGYNHSGISQCLNGRIKTYKGYVWKYAEE